MLLTPDKNKKITSNFIRLTGNYRDLLTNNWHCVPATLWLGNVIVPAFLRKFILLCFHSFILSFSHNFSQQTLSVFNNKTPIPQSLGRGLPLPYPSPGCCLISPRAPVEPTRALVDAPRALQEHSKSLQDHTKSHQEACQEAL